MQSLNRKDHTMTERPKPTPGRGQYALALILGTLAFVAGGISLKMNADFGMKSGLIMAAIFIVSDCAKIILPMVAAAMPGPAIKRRLAYGVAVSISLIAATSYLLETQATRLLQSQARTTAIADARTDADRLRKELSGIGEASSVEALAALAKAKDEAAKAEAADGGCLKKCQDRITEHGEILERLGQAKRRQQLETELATLSTKIEDAPAEAVGASATLAGLTGGDADQIATHEAIVKAILMLIILELLAMFSGEAGNLFVRTWRGRRKLAKPIRKETKSSDTGRKAAEISSEIPAKSYWMKRLAKEQPELARRVISGEISCYKACIEAGIRKAPEIGKAKTKSDWTKPEAYVQETEAVEA
jgi:hypothetical protein